MTKLLWCTDIHLDHLPSDGGGAEAFGRAMAEENPEVLGMVLTGDISLATQLWEHLEGLATGFRRPIYFVLGNHDYYRGSFQAVDDLLSHLDHPHLIWLRKSPLLGNHWALLGNGGWYDGRYGDAMGTPVTMSDWKLIAELAATPERERIMATQFERADALAVELQSQIHAAVQQGAMRLFIATHVPPYPEACWHEGKTTDDNWAPWFTSGATGRALDEAAEANPELQFVVLCGHSHSPGRYARRKNLTVYTGRALYGFPDRAGLIDTDIENPIELVR